MTYTPVRYPGGKTKLYPLVRAVLEENGLLGCDYLEPFAGGAGLAMKLLLRGDVESAAINDADRAVACMWRAIAFESDLLCEFVATAPLDVGTWLEMRDVYRDPASSDLDLGLASFYLNRTSVSGVLGGGIIGGLRQEGSYKMDARFARPGLIEKIRAIGAMRDRVEVSGLDAKEFLARRPGRGFAFLDPPYVKKGPVAVSQSVRRARARGARRVPGGLRRQLGNHIRRRRAGGRALSTLRHPPPRHQLHRERQTHLPGEDDLVAGAAMADSLSGYQERVRGCE